MLSCVIGPVWPVGAGCYSQGSVAHASLKTAVCVICTFSSKSFYHFIGEGQDAVSRCIHVLYLLFHGSNTDNNRGQKRATE